MGRRHSRLSLSVLLGLLGGTVALAAASPVAVRSGFVPVDGARLYFEEVGCRRHVRPLAGGDLRDEIPRIDQ